MRKRVRVILGEERTSFLFSRTASHQRSELLTCSTKRIFFWRGRIQLKARVHLGTESLDFLESKVRSTASGVLALHGLPWLGTLGVQFWNSDDVCGCMQIALRMSTDQLPVRGESHITFDHTSSHNGSCLVTFQSVLGKLQGSSSMSDGKVRDHKTVQLIGACF